MQKYLWITIHKTGETFMNLVPFILFCSFLQKEINTKLDQEMNEKDGEEVRKCFAKGNAGTTEKFGSPAKLTETQKFHEILKELCKEEHEVKHHNYSSLIAQLPSLSSHPVLYREAAYKVFSAVFFEHFRPEREGTLTFFNEGYKEDLEKAKKFFESFLESYDTEISVQEVVIAKLAIYHIGKYLEKEQRNAPK